MVSKAFTTIPHTRRVIYDTYANFPTTGLTSGDLAFATDRLTLYRWNGAAWQEITIYSSSGVIANIPAFADVPAGSIYFATNENILYQNSGAAWVAMPSGNATSGGYTGDSTANRAIAHGLGVAPALVYGFNLTGTDYTFRLINQYAQIRWQGAATTGWRVVTGANATNFYVGNAGSYVQSMNLNTVNYRWAAIG
ncbi:MAG: hypothetical protein CMI54_02305 [Parcubacteria group bacterium]|nr:hypothetical protein [Parcubacteria group bacterium]